MHNQAYKRFSNHVHLAVTRPVQLYLIAGICWKRIGIIQNDVSSMPPAFPFLTCFCNDQLQQVVTSKPHTTYSSNQTCHCWQRNAQMCTIPKYMLLTHTHYMPSTLQKRWHVSGIFTNVHRLGKKSVDLWKQTCKRPFCSSSTKNPPFPLRILLLTNRMSSWHTTWHT